MHRSRRPPPHALAWWRALGLTLGALALACGSAPGGEGGGGGDEDEESGTGTGGPSEPPEPVDVCEVANPLPPGRWEQSLAAMDDEFGGACGNGGRDAFVRVRMEKRADLVVEAHGVAFTPVVSVHDETCIPGSERTYACAHGLPLTVPDLAAGTELVVAVGIDPDDPALDQGGEPDPLGFVVDIGVRHILEAGEICDPPERGRCVDGTACLAEEEGGFTVCTEVPGDLCANAAQRVVAGDGQVEIDPATPWSDDHAHACTGDRVRDLVVRLELDSALADLSDEARLDVSVDEAGVGLAVRAATCLPEDEIACDEPGPAGSSVEVTDLAALAAGGVDLWLFVELAEEPLPAPEEPFFIDLAVVDG